MTQNISTQTSLLSCAAIVLTATLSGCGTQVAVKDVLANPDAHLDTMFATKTLKPEVLKALPVSNAGTFSKATLTLEATEEADGKKRVLGHVANYVNVGNGLVQIRNQFSENGIPYRQNMALDYRGIFALKRQVVFMQRDTANAIYEVKKINQFSEMPLTPAEGTTLNFDIDEGTTVQVVGFANFSKKCVVGKVAAASTILASLDGTAYEIDCQNFGSNKVLSGKQTYVYLSKYGIGYASSGSYTTSKYTTVLKSATFN